MQDKSCFAALLFVSPESPHCWEVKEDHLEHINNNAQVDIAK